MKRIYILIIFIIFISIINTAQAVPLRATDSENMQPKIKIIKNDLPCVDIKSGSWVLEFKNGCKDEVFYTDLECQHDKWHESYEKDGFKLVGNDITVSRTIYSRPDYFVWDKNSFRSINYMGGVWLPCKFNDPFLNEQTNELVIKFKKGDEIYEIVSFIPPENLQKPEAGYRDVAIGIIQVVLGPLLIIIGTINISKNRKNLKKRRGGIILLIIGILLFILIPIFRLQVG